MDGALEWAKAEDDNPQSSFLPESLKDAVALQKGKNFR